MIFTAAKFFEGLFLILAVFGIGISISYFFDLSLGKSVALMGFFFFITLYSKTI